MPLQKKVLGYDQQTGQPIYAEENLPSPMEDSPLDPRPDVGTVPLDDMDRMNGVSADQYADESVPQEVVNDAASQPEVRRAEPNLKPTGAMMDLSFIQALNNAPDDETFNAMVQKLDPVQKHIYDRSYGYERVTPQWATQQAESYYKMQDERQKMAEDPVKQAQLAERSAKVVERQAVQNDFKIRRQNTIKNIEEILADPDYSSLVGPVDGTVGRAYDSAFNQKAQAKRAKLDRLINIDVLDMTKYLRPISQDELKYLRTLVPGQTQHWEVYKQYLGEKLDMLKAADRAVVNPATNQPLPSGDGQPDARPQQNVYQQSQQNPASQLRSQFESSDTLKLPDGRVLKKITKQDGSIGWSE